MSKSRYFRFLSSRRHDPVIGKMSDRQLITLGAVASSDTKPSVTELAQSVQMSPASSSQSAQLLVAMGYLKREEQGPWVRLSLTEKGEALHAKIESLFDMGEAAE
jgi:DNA-binding MarR family transcriptional regulator